MPRAARSAGFSRRHRFSPQGSFGAVLRQSRKVRGRLTVLHVARATNAASRLGIALTRRLVSSARQRNRLKRCIRELFRHHAVKHAGLDLVVTLREKFDAGQMPAIRAEVLDGFERAASGARA